MINLHPKDIRWRQRFENFARAYGQFQSAVGNFERLNLLEKEGLVQRFEYTFELAWKTLKDYLESQGVTARFPRDVIKTAFQYELIHDGEKWLDMLEMRNILTHNYSEDKFNFALRKIKDEYYEAISQVYQQLKSHC